MLLSLNILDDGDDCADGERNRREEEQKRKEEDLVKSAQLLNSRKARQELVIAQKDQELSKREQELNYKKEEIAKEFSETRNKAIEMFNEKFTECQARYYQRYQEIIDDYNRGKDSVTIEETFKRLIEFVNSLTEEEKDTRREGLTDEQKAIFDIHGSY